MFGVVLFQVVSGFGMYAAMSDAWFPQLFAWIVPLMGGDMAVHQWHHLMMWVILVFSLVHIYLVIFTDWMERRAVFSSIINGWKFFEKP
jgi:Ni/Fe-hydrogenase 1 B-type cytochrome subunit